jgi:hypothetical protein
MNPNQRIVRHDTTGLIEKNTPLIFGFLMGNVFQSTFSLSSDDAFCN